VASRHIGKPPYSLPSSTFAEEKERRSMRKTEDFGKHPVPGRVLARLLADELIKASVGGVGNTTTATGGNTDITNGTDDNDGPHVPPPI
jgi:hypothetical protein